MSILLHTYVFGKGEQMVDFSKIVDHAFYKIFNSLLSDFDSCWCTLKCLKRAIIRHHRFRNTRMDHFWTWPTSNGKNDPLSLSYNT